MTVSGILFLAAYTNRSKAYAQALAEAGITIDKVLLFGDPAQDQPYDAPNDGVSIGTLDLFVPDLRKTLEKTCKKAGWSIDACPAENVNDPRIVELLKDFDPKLAIYSGYPGQLVKLEFLYLGIRFLHIHAGWLPDYAGSTAGYYSWLLENSFGVSALLLDEGIDTGPIIARKRHSPPPPGADVDHLYDGAIRADLLVEVLRKFGSSLEFQEAVPNDEGKIYYVIHPVLKHLAILSGEMAGKGSS